MSSEWLLLFSFQLYKSASADSGYKKGCNSSSGVLIPTIARKSKNTQGNLFLTTLLFKSISFGPNKAKYNTFKPSLALQGSSTLWLP